MARKRSGFGFLAGIVRSVSMTSSELAKIGLQVNQDGQRRNAFDLLRYPQNAWADVARIWPELNAVPAQISEQIEIDAAYAGYMDRQDADILAFRRDESLALPVDLNYEEVGSLSTEIRQKLAQARPATLGAASRIPGVTPAAIIALLRFVKKRPKAIPHVKDAQNNVA